MLFTMRCVGYVPRKSYKNCALFIIMEEIPLERALISYHKINHADTDSALAIAAERERINLMMKPSEELRQIVTEDREFYAGLSPLGKLGYFFGFVGNIYTRQLAEDILESRKI